MAVVSKAIAYIGCEVRLADCYETKVKKLENCACWESLGEDVKKSLRLLGKALFCPTCQSPVDKEVHHKVLRFHSQNKAEAEVAPEQHWPRVLFTATDKAGGTARGYRVFPIYEKGSLRRDVVNFGLATWCISSNYNGKFPEEPTSAKFDEVKAWLTKLNIFHKDSFGLKFYFAQEPEIKAG